MSSGSSEVKYISSPVTGGQFGSEVHFLASDGMDKAQRHGVERLARADVKAVVYKLFVFGKMCTFQDFVAAVAFVVEEHVADVLHVHTYLVRAPRLEDALDERDVAEALQHAVVGHGMLAFALGQDSHLEAVLGVAADVTHNRTLILLHVAPYQALVSFRCQAMAFTSVPCQLP